MRTEQLINEASLSSSEATKILTENKHNLTLDQVVTVRDHLKDALCAAQELVNRSEGQEPPKIG